MLCGYLGGKDYCVSLSVHVSKSSTNIKNIALVYICLCVCLCVCMRVLNDSTENTTLTKWGPKLVKHKNIILSVCLSFTLHTDWLLEYEVMSLRSVALSSNPKQSGGRS